MTAKQEGPAPRSGFMLAARGRKIDMVRRTAVMGMLNVTPDWFSDGGKHFGAAEAVGHGERLAAEGADVLDIVGEATRPGWEAVAAGEEIRRVVAGSQR